MEVPLTFWVLLVTAVGLKMGLALLVCRWLEKLDNTNPEGWGLMWGFMEFFEGAVDKAERNLNNILKTEGK